jgi:hypothetical protein
MLSSLLFYKPKEKTKKQIPFLAVESSMIDLGSQSHYSNLIPLVNDFATI